MNSRIVIGIAALLLGACAAAPPPPAPAPPPPPPPPTPDQVFEQLARRYLDEFPRQSPVDATSLGDHRFDDRIDDVSVDGWKAQLDFSERYLAALQPIDRSRLTRANQVDALLLAHELEYQRWRLATLEDWRWNPLIYTRLSGDALYGLIARDFAPEPERLQKLGKRLDELPRFLSQVRESLVPARVPKVHAETAVKQNAGLLSLLDGEIAQRIAALPAADQEGLRASVTRARSALSQHQIWLEKRLAPEAGGDFRLGQKLYDEKLKLRVVLAAVAPGDPRAGRSGAGRDAGGHVRHRAPGAQGPPRRAIAAGKAQRVTAAACHPRRARAGQCRASGARCACSGQPAPRWSTPPISCARKTWCRCPTNRSKSSRCRRSSRAWRWPIAIRPGALEAGQKTFYAVSPIPASWTRAQTEFFLREYNSRSIRNLTVHEAMPGHYLQLAHANRYPSTLRAVLGSGPFVEGWAVYAERLMVDAGYGDGDPLMRLVQLKWYLRTIVNALLDQAVHVDGMSRAAAMKLMTETGFQEEREAAGKWTRAQLTSAQLPVYFVGAQEHFALRAEAEQACRRGIRAASGITTRCCRSARRRCGSRANCSSICRSNS